MTILTIVASVITIAIACSWVINNRESIVLSLLKLKPVGKFLGIRRFHKNRQKALEILLPRLKSSSRIRAMNFKGYSLALETDIPNTILFKLLKDNEKTRIVEVMVHFPDSPAVKKRKDEMGEDYRKSNFQEDIKETLRKIRTINDEFGGKIKLRFFQEPEVLWNMVIWDKGMLVGWYERKLPAYRSSGIEIRPNSILWNRFVKYFENTWNHRSISYESHSCFESIYPNSSCYNELIYRYERSLSRYFNLPPDNKNSLIILIGGGAATGKSTMACELAKVLGIRNIVSTDIIRQVVRYFDSKSEVLQVETWEAFQHLGEINGEHIEYCGLEAQAALIEPALLCAAEFALSKGMPTIIEGIHILPTGTKERLFKKLPNKRTLMFFIDSTEDRISKNFQLRKKTTHMRQVAQGFKNIDKRISLHKQIIQSAKKSKKNIVYGEDWKDLINNALDIVIKHIDNNL